jgi:hypothetical protein
VAKRDLDKATSRFLNALRRIGAGLEQQRDRVLDRAARAPRLLPGSEYEVIDLTGDIGNDLDYYVYELGRLRAVGDSIIKVFGRPPELVDARATFDAGFPDLRQIRDPLTHPNDNNELDDVAWFSSVVKLKSDGSVEDLVDPRYEQHDVATVYHALLTAFLRARLRASIATIRPTGS